MVSFSVTIIHALLSKHILDKEMASFKYDEEKQADLSTNTG